MNKKDSKIEIISYLFFGGLTTLVNIITFFIFNSLLGTDYKLATSIAWILSVVFAFITNKRFVFQSKNSSSKEILPFLTFRIMSYLMDIGLMIILIEAIHLHPLLSKVLVNVLVVLFNYIASKYFVFNRKTYSSMEGGK